MNIFHNILVVIEPKQLRQPALERGIALYNYAKAHALAKNSHEEVKIIALLAIEKQAWNLSSFLAVDKEQLEKDYLKKHEQWLKAYLAINAIGVKVEPVVVFSKEIGKDIVSIVKEQGCDILIKTSSVHGLLDSIFFTPLDLQMLRHSPIPVCIAKDHLFEAQGSIAVALDLVDPDDTLSRLTNLRLLREAQKLSKFTGCKIVLINAVAPFVPPIAMDVPGFTPQSVYKERFNDGKNLAEEFAKRHMIAPENCIVEEGTLEDVIIHQCQKIKPTALFIGTSARRGLANAIVGNVCERLLENLACDIVVITPKAVVRNLPTSEPSKKIE